MRVPALPFFAELGDRPREAVRDEHRVVAEALLAAPLRRDRAIEPAGAGTLLALRRERDDDGDHPRAPVGLAREALEERVGLGPGRRPPRRVEPRLAAERVALDPGVLAEHPAVRDEPAGEGGLDPGVLLVRR